MTINDLIATLPLVFILVWATLLLLVETFLPKDRKWVTPFLAALGLAAAIGITLARPGGPVEAYNGMVVVDGFAVFLEVLFLAGGLVGIGLAYDYLKRMDLERGEYYVLLLFSVGGMLLMAYANDLIIVFLALELLSIPLYILSGFAHPRPESEEAALKYFLMGSFSSAFLLYGVALIYGATQGTALPVIVGAVQAGTANLSLLLPGAALVLVGAAFKAAIVPFHMWTPDVYQGAPTPVTAFMTVGAKAAGFAALMRVFAVAFPSLSTQLTPIMAFLAALTMMVGNIVALGQTNMKRLLAYASIAQSGYILMAFVPYGNGAVLSDSVASMLFYLLAYSLTTLGAWSVVIAVERAEGRGLEIDDYAGLGRKMPWLGLAMAVFMLSFTGVPLTLGFWGKLYLFSTAVEAGYLWLALVGLLTSAISAYYYLRVIVVMFMRPGDPILRVSTWVRLTAIVSALLVVILAFIPAQVLELAANAVLRLL